MTADAMHDQENGVILIAVLLVVAILAALAATAIDIARSDTLIARNIVAEAQAKALAEAGITEAMASLIAGGRAGPWRPDGTPRTITVGNQKVTVALQDELGKIDLNAAPDEALRGLFVSLGVRPDDADWIVDAIADWRDPDDLKRLHGAERDDYAAAGRSYGPRNGPFESVRELEQVLGLSPDLVGRAAPALTIYTRRPSIDTTVAPPEVLRALPAMDNAKIDALVAARGNATTASSATSPMDLAGRPFSVTADASAAGLTTRRSVVVRFTGSPERPYWVHEWR